MTTVTGQITASSGQIAALTIAALTTEIAHELPVGIQAGIRRNNSKSAWSVLQNAYEMLLEARPNDRSPLDRHYAVAKTDLEKVMAYFQIYILNSHDGEAPTT